MKMKTKFVRLLATGAIALAGGLIATAGIAGAQSVPVQPPVTNPPVQPAQPPQSPVEPPSNAGNAGGAARLPTTGTAGAGDGDSTTSLAFGALAVALAAGGAASWRLGRRVH